MKAKDLVVIGLAAALTAGATSLVWPTNSTANADVPAVLTPTQDAPAIEHQGAVFKLLPEGQRYKPGDRPSYRLQVTDLSGQARRVPVKLTLASQYPSSPMSRVVAMPQQRWQDELLVMVVPGRTRSIRIQPGVALAAGQQAILTIQVGAEQAQSSRLVLAPEAPDGKPVDPFAGLLQQRPKA